MEIFTAVVEVEEGQRQQAGAEDSLEVEGGDLVGEVVEGVEEVEEVEVTQVRTSSTVSRRASMTKWSDTMTDCRLTTLWRRTAAVGMVVVVGRDILVIRDHTNTRDLNLLNTNTIFLHLMRSQMTWKLSAWTSLFDYMERT